MKDNNENNRIPQGIFITKGMKISVPEFFIQMDENGNLNSNITLHTGLDMTPYWLNISFKHLILTETAHKKLLISNINNENSKIAKYLELEFSSGMQSIMSSAIAIDAYYSSIKEKIVIPTDLVKKWRDNKVSRYKQICEVLRRAFRLNNDSTTQIRYALKESFKYRDMAVHPAYGTTAPVYYEELNKVSDWRFAAFRFHNAKILYSLIFSIIHQTAHKVLNTENVALNNYCRELSPDLCELKQRWDKRYGKYF